MNIFLRIQVLNQKKNRVAGEGGRGGRGAFEGRGALE